MERGAWDSFNKRRRLLLSLSLDLPRGLSSWSTVFAGVYNGWCAGQLGAGQPLIIVLGLQTFFHHKRSLVQEADIANTAMWPISESNNDRYIAPSFTVLAGSSL